VLLLQADLNEFRKDDDDDVNRYRRRLQTFVLRTLDALAVDPGVRRR